MAQVSLQSISLVIEPNNEEKVFTEQSSKLFTKVIEKSFEVEYDGYSFLLTKSLNDTKEIDKVIVKVNEVSKLLVEENE